MKYEGYKRNKCWKTICEKPAVKKGYCSSHYAIESRNGRWNLTDEKCSKENCGRPIYSTHTVCWKHFRGQQKEGSKRWEIIKKNPELKAIVGEQHAQYDKKRRALPEVQKRERASKRIWWQKNREALIIRLREYKKNLTPEQKLLQNRKRNAKTHFGGWDNREAIVQRDGEKCVNCGITRVEHYERYKQDLHVNHKDRYGRLVKKELKNNNPDNLETLCLMCHAKRKQEQNAILIKEEDLRYGSDWNDKLRREIRKRDNYTCQECKITEDDLGKPLDVHHVNDDQHNNKSENLLALCPACHWNRHHMESKPQR